MGEKHSQINKTIYGKNLDRKITLKIQTSILAPELQKARNTNQVRPFLSNIIAEKTLQNITDEKKLFEYTPSNIPLITTGLKLT